MSTIVPQNLVRKLQRNAPLFAALGDGVRLTLLTRLSDGGLRSITTLSEDSSLTRQAITKHLRILEGVGLVRGIRRGRESLFQIESKRLTEASDLLGVISRQWDDALSRLKAFVEDGAGH